MLNRIVSIKGLGLPGEIVLEQEQPKVAEQIEQIERIQEKVSALPGEAKNDILEGLQSINKKLLITALLKIRVNTTFLWPALAESALKKRQKNIQVSIRESTFKRVKGDLDILASSKLLKYRCTLDKTYINEYTFCLEVYEMQERLFELILEMARV